MIIQCQEDVTDEFRAATAVLNKLGSRGTRSTTCS